VGFFQVVVFFFFFSRRYGPPYKSLRFCRLVGVVVGRLAGWAGGLGAWGLEAGSGKRRVMDGISNFWILK